MAQFEDRSIEYINAETLTNTTHGRVFRVHRAGDATPFALKQRHSGDVALQRKLLEHELNALKRLDSPLVVRGVEVCDFEGQPSLVCAFAPGEALGPTSHLSFDALLDVARQSARALSHIHEHGVVHNDIKPSNLLYDVAAKQLTVIDFELAHLPGSPKNEQAMVEGSLPYLPPERTGRMNRLADYRADFYSLGVTLFELASGRLPYEATDVLGWAHAHLSKTAPLLSDVTPQIPRGFAEVVAKLLVKSPDERYQSAFGLLHDLNTCIERWGSTGDVPSFTLGVHDVSQAFEVSRTLVGRAADLEACKRALARADEAPQLLLLSGNAGSGKTALLHAFIEEARSMGCTTVRGNFEQHNQGRPYSALVGALEDLIARALVQSDAALGELRQRLTDALGANTAVIAEFAPRAEQVLGPQPAPTPLNPSEAKHRLQGVLLSFVRAFVSPGQTLVLSLDDCQWMDAATSDVIEHLLEADLKNLLLVASHRSALPSSHPLDKLTREGRTNVQSSNVANLSIEAVGALLSASCRATSEDVQELARVVHDKTDGNPFFVNELLEALASDQAFVFDSNLGQWRWDIEKVRACQVADNVADLVAERLKRLGSMGQEVLGAAACQGLVFDLQAVASMTGQSPGHTQSLLLQAASQRLLVPLTTDGEFESDAAVRFSFPHTRVLEAAYANLDEPTRARLHYHIGSNLLERWEKDEQSASLFDVLHHLDAGHSRITSPQERLRLIELNLKGVERARRTAAFDVARGYAEFGASLLAAAEVAATSDVAFRVRYSLAEAVYLAGDFALAREHTNTCFSAAPTPLLRAKIHALRARIADHEANLPDAISEIRAGLAALGVHLPEAHSEIDQAIGPGIEKMMARLAEIPIEDLAKLPTVQSPETALVLELLMQVVPPSIQTYPPLFIVAELMMFDLELQHGVTAVSCKNFVDCGILQSSILGNQDAAYRLGRVAFELLERFKPTPLEAAVNFVFAGFVSHWKAHFREAEAAYEHVKRVGTELGDLPHVAYAYAHHTQRSLYVGRPLSDLAKEVDEALVFLTRGRHLGPAVGTTVAARAVARLCAKEGSEAAVAAQDAAATQSVLDSKNAQWGYSYGQGQMMVSVFLRDAGAARHWQDFTRPFSLAAASLFSVPDYHLFNALVDLGRWAEAGDQPTELLAGVDRALAKLEGWAKAAPENFGHKYELLRAERARATGESLDVILDGYQRCIEAAGHDFPHFRALTHELEAELWLSRGMARRARPALEEAYRLYGVWGATAKLKQLEGRHPWLKAGTLRDELGGSRTATPTTTTTSASLDADSILKATQAISKEVETRKLFAALMTTLIESAGAEQGCLVLENDGDHAHYVEARAAVDGALDFTDPEPLEAAEKVCASVVRYVVRSREVVVLDDAANGGPFQQDPYIKQHHVRSLLCVPILRQGQVLGVLYLENNQTTHAFTRERVGLLQVIASQAAISIYNAQLYSSLERRVNERTAELAQKNRQIATMLDNMDQGVFTIDSTLVIQPGYSRHLEQILGTTDLVGKHCMNVLFEGSSLRPDVLNAADGALQFSFGVESWLAETNAYHLIRQFQRPSKTGATQFLEVDWNFICDERDVVEKVLVVVRDVTVMRELQQAATERGQEADIVTQVIESGVEALAEFAQLARQYLAENVAALDADGVPPVADLTRSFRNLHTLKGNARLLGYTHIVDAIHAAEELYAGLRKNVDEHVDPATLRVGLDAVARAVNHYEAVSRNKLAKLTRGPDRRLHELIREIGAIVHTAATSANTNALAEVARVLQWVDGSMLSDLVLETSRLVPSLAGELHKPTPVVQTIGGNVILTKEWATPVKDVLVQCFRNALYHGLEAQDERLIAGKTAAGCICIEAKATPGGLAVHIHDDGRGLALKALREAPERRDWNDAQLAESVFQSGVSTAKEVGLIAGRGVGLDIVREALRRGGGEVALRFTGEENDGFRPFALVLNLPATAVLGEASSVRSNDNLAAAE